MNIDQVISVVYRILFAGGFVLLALGALERLSFAFGYTILRGVFSGGRLIEIAAVVLVFVIALLLRQIREELKETSAG
jgi:hypothetical protein